MISGGPAGRRAGGQAGRVTALAPDVRRAGTVRIEVDGAPFGAVPADVIQREEVVVGRELDGGLLARLTAAVDDEAAFRTVLRAIEQRAYARADLGRRLVRKGHPREAVERALEEAARLGLLDDREFARFFVQTRSARGRGPGRLVRDLLALGVARSHIDHAIAEQWPEGVDAETPKRLAARRASQLGDLPRPVLRRRLLAYLARRGYGGSEAIEAVRTVLAPGGTSRFA